MPGRHPLSRHAPTPERREALAAFFAAHHRHLTLRLYAWTVAISVWDIDDACSFAWLQLAGRPDITLDRRGFAWVTTVALREARRLAKAPELESRPDRSNLRSDPLERALTRLDHRERARRFAQLKPREQRELFLQAAGFTYSEIAAMTDSSWTAVSRRIREGRARLQDT